MLELLGMLRELNIVSVAFRLVLAMLLGGAIGLERGQKRRPAGFRTYLLVCMGAALTMLLGQYYSDMADSTWSLLNDGAGVNTDVSRMSAQVINGIGFLGAGTIIVTGRQEIKGLTTAAGLWASACMGLAVGAGFYECVLLAFLLILISIRILPRLEVRILEKTRNMNIYVELESMDDIGAVINRVKAQNVQILDVEVDRGRNENASHPSITFALRLNRKQIHTQLLTAIAELSCVYVIEEL